MTWQSIYLDNYPFERGDDGWTITPPKAEWDAWKRAHPDHCRDCGTKHGLYNCGGTRPDLGSFWLCNSCSTIDGCSDRLGDGTHVSHWGDTHTVGEHHSLAAERDRRRDAYLRDHPSDLQPDLFEGQLA